MPKATEIKAPAVFSSMWYLGVDPGDKGGLTLLDSRGKVLSISPIPKLATELYEWGKQNLLDASYLTIMVEKVGSMPRQNVKAIFTFGRNYERVQTVLEIIALLRFEANLPTTFCDATPQEWMKPLKLTKVVNDFKTKTQWKRYLRSIGMRMFPELVIWKRWNEGMKDAVSDSLLIAHYAWKISQ